MQSIKFYVVPRVLKKYSTQSMIVLQQSMILRTVSPYQKVKSELDLFINVGLSGKIDS
jgi:hypothetical protein